MEKEFNLQDHEANYSITVVMEDGEVKQYVTSKQLLLNILQLSLFEEHKIKEIHYFNLKLKQRNEKSSS